MSQSARDTRDYEGDNNADGKQLSQFPELFSVLFQEVNEIRTILQQQQPSQGEPSFNENPRPFFTISSKAAEEEDNEMVDRWQKDAKGILIFTGLFSAAVSVLLSLTIPDLKPDSQAASALYLWNIYEVLADPNFTRASIPSPAATTPPPRHAVWVNVLWFLSLVMSVSCALLATSLQQWARRYIHLTQPARCNPEKRARMRGFYKNGVDEMYIWLAVEGLPTLLHLSLFLFFGGLAVFLFNVDHEIFTWVAVWIGLFSMVYGLITLLPLIRKDSPYVTPLSTPFWYIWTSIQCVTSKAFAFFAQYRDVPTWEHFDDLRDRYLSRIKRGMEKSAEKTALERVSEIDSRIFGRTINSLGDDDSLEKFFEAIPGFFNSEPGRGLERDFPEPLLVTFWDALDGFMSRNFSSHSVTETVKSYRDTICGDIMSMIPCSEYNMTDNLRPHYNKAPATIERFQAMARWIPHRSHDVSFPVRWRFAKTFAERQELDDDWIALAYEVFGLPDPHEFALSRNDAMLSILIHVCRQIKHSDELGLVEALTQFNISDTLSGLQLNFCRLWNELFRNATRFSTPVQILRLTRHLYNDLYQGTDSALPASIDSNDLLRPSSYRSCTIVGHCSDLIAYPFFPTRPGDSPIASPRLSTSGGSTALRLEATTVGPRSFSDLTADVSPPGAIPAIPEDFPALSSTTPPGSPPSDNVELP